MIALVASDQISQQRTQFLSLVTEVSTTSNMIILTDVHTLYTGNSVTHTVNLHFPLCTSAKVAACILQKIIL